MSAIRLETLHVNTRLDLQKHPKEGRSYCCGCSLVGEAGDKIYLCQYHEGYDDACDEHDRGY